MVWRAVHSKAVGYIPLHWNPFHPMEWKATVSVGLDTLRQVSNATRMRR